MLTIKILHMLTVLITFSLFVLRGVGLLLDAGFVRRKWLRIAPHVNDTVLLGSGIALTIYIQQYPLSHAWLTAKLFALLIYIGLGMYAFRFAPNQRQRLVAWLAALLVFGYMLGVAYTHSAHSWRVLV